jgi:anthranilate synthase component 1
VHDAHAVFHAYPERFAALLEDPAGGGRQFLVSASGHSHAYDGSESPDHVFKAWKEGVSGSIPDALPGIRCLVYAAYEAGGWIERLPRPKTPLPGCQLYLHYPEWSLCFDREAGCIYLVASRGEAQLDELEALIERPAECVDTMSPHVPPATASSSEAYCRAVERVRDYIRAGDVFQVNIARFWQTQLDEAALPSLYASLRSVNPAPFSAFMRMQCAHGPFYILSASPERLCRLDAHGMADTRPIAGTRRRGEGEDDARLGAELLISEKERAEHIMLVDLERNDLGRVCVPGTVAVTERMVIERYATVQHIVSNVQGRLAKGMDAVDLFRAMFPGGTITGCPKVRCMEIIHELEPQARGPYTGTIGYIGWDGSVDMNILIRSFWWQQGQLSWAAGAGIVADSNPAHELAETGHKAAGLLRALKIDGSGGQA